MKILTQLTFFIFIAVSGFGQQTSKAPAHTDTLIATTGVHIYVDSAWEPYDLPYQRCSVSLSTRPIAFDIIDTIIKSPGMRGTPIEFSVVFQGNMVTLFKPGRFVCYALPSLARNIALEDKLNTMKFQRHWLLGNKLVALSGKQMYCMNADFNWEIYKDEIQLKNRSKLFDDEQYIVFEGCSGEFGGHVYFYNKLTREMHFMCAACANTVFKKGNAYCVLANLDHGFPTSELYVIEHPDSLPIYDTATINEMERQDARRLWIDAVADRRAKTLESARKGFMFIGLETLSTFQYAGRTLYLLKRRGKIFLAEINGNAVTIVHPLFNGDQPTHSAITQQYDGGALINLIYYRSQHNGIAALVIENGKLIRIHWNWKPKHLN